MAKKKTVYQQLNLKNKLSNRKNRDRVMDKESVLMAVMLKAG